MIAQFLRYSEMAGVRPRLPRRLRVAAIVGASPTHMTQQISASISVGVHRVLGLSVTQPVEQLVEMLNRFQPEFVAAYPSMATRLAEEQLAGRLRLTLGGMSTSSELRTPEMTERIAEAFGVHPFDLYGTTEGLWGRVRTSSGDTPLRGRHARRERGRRWAARARRRTGHAPAGDEPPQPGAAGHPPGAV
jgi:phenylacetate-CoA ligase